MPFGFNKCFKRVSNRDARYIVCRKIAVSPRRLGNIVELLRLPRHLTVHMKQVISQLRDAEGSSDFKKRNGFARRHGYLGRVIRSRRLETAMQTTYSTNRLKPPTNNTELFLFLEMFLLFRAQICQDSGTAQLKVDETQPKPFGVLTTEELSPTHDLQKRLVCHRYFHDRTL